MGYELFLDRGKIAATFIAADIFEDDEENAQNEDNEKEGKRGLRSLDGKIDMIYTGSFFHLFDLEHQHLIAKRIVRFLKPNTKDAMILGRQVGFETPLEQDSPTAPNGKMFRHNVASLREMWARVGEETGTKWEVNASLEEFPTTGTQAWVEPDAKLLKFVVRKLV